MRNLLTPFRRLLSCDASEAPPPLQTPFAGRAGSESSLKQPAGSGYPGKAGRPATYDRRTYASRSWERPGGRKWVWGADGKPRSTKTVRWLDSADIIDPCRGLSPEQARMAWPTLALMAAGRSPFKRLFASATARAFS